MDIALGLDIGGTGIKAALIDSHGSILDMKTLPTDAAKGRDHILGKVHSIIQEFQQKADLIGIGIASAGRIDTESRSVYYATDNLPGWTGLSFQKEIADVYRLPIAVDNDVNGATLGEAWKGNDKVYSSLFLLSLGTGVGGGLMSGGKVLRGHHGAFAEVGHWILYPHGLPCNCGFHGCSEQYVSGTALHRRIFEATGYKAVNKQDIWKEDVQNQPLIREVMNHYCSDLAMLIHQILMAYDPEELVIGGGLAEDHNKYEHLLFEKLGSDKEKVRFTSLGNKAGVLGAAKLLFDNLAVVRA